ncbi:hypothetical protein F0562_008819 [Nyssa sinensis]|uniref:Uncharacterized protein n=1 Tax=Nyssa sinensis TaxID=561372 RepID=A0A5J5AAN7_9ASTE|nr:hypothetical protein F0562_008819 [Nyssa sinensis]
MNIAKGHGKQNWKIMTMTVKKLAYRKAKMENSMTSMSKALSAKARAVDSREESSWTFYFEDFLCNKNEDKSLSSGHESPSLVSDASSSAAKKITNNNLQLAGFCLDKSCKKLSFKERKSTKGALVDDPLEDTASSPVNSPKV